jgi:hypothetical protein
VPLCNKNPQVPTPLNRATAFLWATHSAFWWEPLEMCRKLALSGWVLIIPEEFEQARVPVTLLVSIGFFALHLSMRPFIR